MIMSKLTKEQFQHYQNLKHVHQSSTSHSLPCNPEVPIPEETGFAHFSGVLNHPLVNSAVFHTCAVSSLGTDSWTLDSSATNHKTPPQTSLTQHQSFSHSSFNQLT